MGAWADRARLVTWFNGDGRVKTQEPAYTGSRPVDKDGKLCL